MIQFLSFRQGLHEFDHGFPSAYEIADPEAILRYEGLATCVWGRETC